MIHVNQYDAKVALNLVLRPGDAGPGVIGGVATIVESVFSDDAILIAFELKFDGRLPKGTPPIKSTDENTMLIEGHPVATVNVLRMTPDRLWGVGNIGIWHQPGATPLEE